MRRPKKATVSVTGSKGKVVLAQKDPVKISNGSSSMKRRRPTHLSEYSTSRLTHNINRLNKKIMKTIGN
ncbi:hypothetical protein M3202_21225 [Alkalihalobacillus oceani]|uniref:Uncharacterized protein n=1 Tax=Halalkalibacter oceani TaxID=1653776 RepID=A0A9X2IQ01_9BACI|nr:hypothetical protein [Halalkalibacter oceani]MCM3716569.1 hypothetical protein [Halalkalibacter oceani]